jgi:hypothetical protein
LPNGGIGAGLVPIPALPNGGIGAGLVPIPALLNGGIGAGLVPIAIIPSGGKAPVPNPPTLRRIVTPLNTTNNASKNARL